MQDKLYDEIVITKDTWGDETAERLGYTIMTLAAEGEVCQVYDDDEGIYLIHHNHNELKDYWGGPVCEWLTDEEYETIESMREHNGEEDSESGAELEDEEEPTFGTVAAEFYFEADQLLEAYQNAEMNAEDTLEKIIYILNKAEEAEND